MISHHCHAQLDHCALRSFVAELTGTAGEQTGNGAFHPWSAVPTGTGAVHLVRSPLAVQARLVEPGADLGSGGRGVDALDGLWNADRENASSMEDLAHRQVICAQITGHGMDGQPDARLDPCDGRLDSVNEGHHRAGIGWIAHGEQRREDNAGCRLRNQAGLAAKLDGAVAFALEDRSTGAILGIADFAVVQPLPLGQPP